GGHPTSTPTCTSSATSSNAPSPCSSSGAHWPPGMTSTPPSTAAPSSSPQSSPGYAVRRHALGGDAVGLVDDEERGTGRAQPRDDVVLGELLGREEEVLGRAARHRVPRLPGVGGAQRGVHRDASGASG